VILVRGAAGTGKTSLLLETVEAIEATGTRVFAFAPSARASRGVLQEKGFAEADTLARLLLDQELQERSRGQVLLIDEAGMVGVRTMCKLLELADKLDCRVILAGDRYQHGSVEAGAALRLLEEQAGLTRSIEQPLDGLRRGLPAIANSRTILEPCRPAAMEFFNDDGRPGDHAYFANCWYLGVSRVS
jgi:ATP-dependent exoDNAse (exonuclease V) alpha subunit